MSAEFNKVKPVLWSTGISFIRKLAAVVAWIAIAAGLNADLPKLYEDWHTINVISVSASQIFRIAFVTLIGIFFWQIPRKTKLQYLVLIEVHVAKITGTILGNPAKNKQRYLRLASIGGFVLLVTTVLAAKSEYPLVWSAIVGLVAGCSVYLSIITFSEELPVSTTAPKSKTRIARDKLQAEYSKAHQADLASLSQNSSISASSDDPVLKNLASFPLKKYPEAQPGFPIGKLSEKYSELQCWEAPRFPYQKHFIPSTDPKHLDVPPYDRPREVEIGVVQINSQLSAEPIQNATIAIEQPAEYETARTTLLTAQKFDQKYVRETQGTVVWWPETGLKVVLLPDSFVVIGQDSILPFNPQDKVLASRVFDRSQLCFLTYENESVPVRYDYDRHSMRLFAEIVGEEGATPEESLGRFVNGGDYAQVSGKVHHMSNGDVEIVDTWILVPYTK